jgi:transaldolase
VARIADVFSVIESSIRLGSIVRVSGSISTNIGLQFSQTMLEVVATYEKGVVIISPFKSRALIAI